MYIYIYMYIYAHMCIFMHMYVYRTRFLYDHDIELYKFRQYIYIYIYIYVYLTLMLYLRNGTWFLFGINFSSIFILYVFLSYSTKLIPTRYLIFPIFLSHILHILSSSFLQYLFSIFFSILPHFALDLYLVIRLVFSYISFH